MIVFQCKDSLQRGMSSLILLTLYMLQKRAPWTTYLPESTNRHLAYRALVWHIWDMGNAWTWQHMCPRSFFIFLKNDGHGRTRLGHGLCYQKKKKKSVTHYLSHQSPPTSSHTDLLRCQSSSHPDLFFFSFSSIYFSFAVPPFALILVLFVSFFSLFFLLLLFFFLFHTITHVELFYLQPSTWTKDV